MLWIFAKTFSKSKKFGELYWFTKFAKVFSKNFYCTVSYQPMVGSLLYISTAKGPNIAQTVELVSNFPTEAHLTAVKWIFCYLKGTINFDMRHQLISAWLSFWMQSGQEVWITYNNYYSTQEIRSWILEHSYNLVQQEATTCCIVSYWSRVASYMVLSTAMQEATWLSRLLSDIKMWMDLGPAGNWMVNLWSRGSVLGCKA